MFVGLLFKVGCNGTPAFLVASRALATHSALTFTSIRHHATRIGSRVGVPELVAAISNAGGLGNLTALIQPNSNALREAIRETRTLTDKNFGVNITFLPSINPPNYEGYARTEVEEGFKVFETAGDNREYDFCPFWWGIDVLVSRTLHQLLQGEWMYRDPQM